MSILKTEELSINFGSLWAVKNVNMEIKQGRNLGTLLGPTVQERPTFFNLISGMYKPSRGKIYINSEEVTGLLPNQIKKTGSRKDLSEFTALLGHECS